MSLFDKLFRRKKDVDFPPRPKWRPNLPVDIEAIYDKARFYTGDKLQLAILQNGTVVFFADRVIDIAQSALNTIDRIYNAHPDFKPISMDDGNYLVEYSQPAFTIVFKSEIDTHWSYIEENHQDGVCPAEVLIDSAGQHNVFDRVGKICLFGRAQMFMDAQSPKVVRMFDPMIK